MSIDMHEFVERAVAHKVGTQDLTSGLADVRGAQLPPLSSRKASHNFCVSRSALFAMSKINCLSSISVVRPLLEASCSNAARVSASNSTPINCFCVDGYLGTSVLFPTGPVPSRSHSNSTASAFANLATTSGRGLALPASYREICAAATPLTSAKSACDQPCPERALINRCAKPSSIVTQNSHKQY